MKYLCIVLLFVASSSALSPEAEKVFKNFMTAYPEKFQTKKEIEMRRALFSDAYDHIMEHNADGTHSYKLGFTPQSILTNKERTSLIGRRISTPFLTRNAAVSVESIVNELPEKRAAAVSPVAYDSRNTTCGAQMKIKYQGSRCGSCWSFSALAPIEYAQCNKTKGNYTALSEQQLTSCVKPGKGCTSGDLTGTFNWILGNNNKTKAAGTVATAASYPYVSGDSGIPGTCNTTGLTVGATLKSVTLLPCAAIGGTASVTTAIENAIMQNGVVSNCLYIPVNSDGTIHRTFDLYTAGVYSEKTLCSKFKGCNQKSTNINHCTALVGWGYDSVSKKNYWIMRNQWGTSWGIKGYMWIEKGVNMCGIESSIYYTTVA